MGEKVTTASPVQCPEASPRSQVTHTKEQSPSLSNSLAKISFPGADALLLSTDAGVYLGVKVLLSNRIPGSKFHSLTLAV